MSLMWAAWLRFIGVQAIVMGTVILWAPVSADAVVRYADPASSVAREHATRRHVL